MREKLIDIITDYADFLDWERIDGIADTIMEKCFATDNNVGDKWIPVSERLPDEDGKYLVFEQSGGRTVTSVLRFAKDARKVDRYDFRGRWKNAWYEYDSEWGHYTVDSVTHWMPLPQPPKEGE